MKKIIVVLAFIFFLPIPTTFAMTLDGVLEAATGPNLSALVEIPEVSSEVTTIEKVTTLALMIIRILLFVVGLASVAVITYAGMRYTLSGPSDESRDAAKKALLYAVLGLIATFLALIIVQNVVRILY